MTQPKIDGVGHGVPRMLYASDGSNWYAILVDSDGHVKIDVVSAALPTDAATQTTLASCLTALQLIDDLRAALGSVNTDDLQVDVKTYPGSNALGNFPFGYYDRWAENLGLTAAATSGTKNSTAVPAGEVWILEMTSMMNFSAAGSIFAIDIFTSAGFLLRGIRETAIVQYGATVLHGPLTLKEGDYIQLVYGGVAVGNDLRFGAWGYKMKIA